MLVLWLNLSISDDGHGYSMVSWRLMYIEKTECKAKAEGNSKKIDMIRSKEQTWRDQ